MTNINFLIIKNHLLFNKHTYNYIDLNLIKVY